MLKQNIQVMVSSFSFDSDLKIKATQLEIASLLAQSLHQKVSLHSDINHLNDNSKHILQQRAGSEAGHGLFNFHLFLLFLGPSRLYVFQFFVCVLRT